MLTILGVGNSLPPFVLFRGTPKGIKKKKLKLHPKVITGDIYICCQANSWVDEPTISCYLKDVWFKEGIYKKVNDTLLIMVRARSHFSDDITTIFENHNVDFILIPPG